VAKTTRPAYRPPTFSGDTGTSGDDDTDDTDAGPHVTSGSAVSEGRHKPFNIQIDAVMDRANAEQMVGRLQRLGYHAFLAPTNIEGQTWWRVKVGPYHSEDEAATAEQQLREQYRDTYSNE
jgi:cell division septation protein DedD